MIYYIRYFFAACISNRNEVETHMITRLASGLFLAALILLCIPLHGWSADSHIGGVQISPDLRQIFIKCDNPVGRHSAFIMQRPYRLVLDFDSMGLAKVPGKIAVNRGGISEIRLGSNNNKARIVIDFGDSPVPAFNIEKRSEMAVVNLGDAGGYRPQEAAERTFSPEPKMLPAPKHVKSAVPTNKNTEIAAIRQSAKYNLPSLQVRKSGLKDNLVFVELVDRRDPKQLYRLVVDLDHKNLDVRQASISDAGGKLRTFDLAAKEESNSRSAQQQAKLIGPRKDAPAESDAAVVDVIKDKYKWGKGPDQTASLDSPRQGSPFKIEQFRLQARNSNPLEK